MTHNLFGWEWGSKSCCILEGSWRNFCLRKWDWDKLTLGIWARTCHFYKCTCAHVDTHTQDEVYFTIPTSGNDVCIVKRFQIPSRKPLGYKKNRPTSNKPIWDMSPIWQSPVLLYSNKLVLGFLSQLLLLLFKMYWALEMNEMLCTTVRTPTSLGCASIKWCHLWGVLSTQDT